MGQGPRIGYIGIDAMTGAAASGEAMGLLKSGVPLELISVYRIEKPITGEDEAVDSLRHMAQALEPIGIARALGVCLLAPILFGRRFWMALGKAIFNQPEGPGDWFEGLAHWIPALRLAIRWRRRGIGHIHAHSANAATAIAMHTAELLGIGYSFTGHATGLHEHRAGLIAKLRRARFVVCLSEYHRRLYLSLGADPSRLSVVYSGVDVGRLAEASASVVAPAAAEETPPRILGLGRLVEGNGFDDLIVACALLRAEETEFECVIAGAGPEYERLARLIIHCHLEGHVRLTGRNVSEEDLAGLITSSRIVALPCVSDREGDMDGLPRALIESLACGRPTVTTRLGGIPDLVRDGEYGLLVEPGDVRGLALALGRLLAYPYLAAHMGEQGQAWAREHFGLDKAVYRLAYLFRWASEAPGHSPPDKIWPAAPGAELEYRGPRLTGATR